MCRQHEQINLKATAKRQRIEVLTRGKPFSYAGNSRADVSVWEAAAEVIRVNCSSSPEICAPSRAEILTHGSRVSICGKPCGHISGRKMVCCSFLSRWRIKLVTRIACCILYWVHLFLLIQCVPQQRSAGSGVRSLAQHKNETAGCRYPANSDRYGGGHCSALAAFTCPPADQRIRDNYFGILMLAVL